LYDVLIVGAGPAGSTLARMIGAARKKIRQNTTAFTNLFMTIQSL